MNTRCSPPPAALPLLALLALLAFPAPASAGAETAVERCDRLASHPDDPGRVAPGVATAQMDKPTALEACRAAVELEPRNARSRYQLARVLFYGGQNAPAIEQMRIAADAGYPQAQFVFGTFVARGREGAPQDICLAERYWRSAASGRQAARVQYVRHALTGRFAGCADVATHGELEAMLSRAAAEARDFYERLLIDDLTEALAAAAVDGNQGNAA